MSNNLGAPSVAVNQLAKETTVNDAVGRLDAAITERLAITLTAGNTVSSPTTSQLQQAYLIEFIPDSGSPPVATNSKTLELKSDLKKSYIVMNRCVCPIRVVRHSNNSEEVVVPPHTAILVINKDPLSTNQVVQVSPGYLSMVKQPVRIAWGSNVAISTALNNGDSLDGVTLATGDRVLLFGQTTGSENGIYVVGTTPVRSSDASFTGSLSPGTLIPVISGSNASKVFYCANASQPVVGTDSISFSSITQTSPYIFGFDTSGTPTASSRVWKMMVTDVHFYLPDNFSGSVGHVDTAPSATTDFDVQRNGTSIGTISVSTGGAVSFSTAGAGNENFVASDRISVHAPASLNGLAGLAVTFRGTRS